MRIAKRSLMLCCLFLFISITNLFADKSRSSFFFNGSFGDLQQRAMDEGKPFMIWFYTDWCDPCDQMAGETFGNEELQKYIDEYYLAYQIDADEMTNQGISLASSFDVMFFPTLMVFHADGDVAWQSAGYRSASDLLGVLSEIRPADAASQPMAMPIMVADLNPDMLDSPAEPRDQEGYDDFSDFTPTLALDYTPEAAAETNSLLIEDVWYDAPVVNDVPEPAPILPEPVPTEVPMPVVPTNPLPDGPGTYQIQLSGSPSQGYAVQVGVFADYENVLRMVAKLEDDYTHPVLVNIAELRGKPVFKVMVGAFPEYTKAYKLQQSYMQESRMDAIIVNLDHF